MTKPQTAGRVTRSSGRGLNIVLGLCATAVMGVAAALLPPAAAARSCQPVRVDGKPVLVQVQNVSCRRGRPIARRFSATGALPSGWEGRNPGGCEWVLFRKRDRARVIRNGYQAPPGVPTILTVRDRGCTS